MEKFSLYDFLGLLLPGVFFLLIFNLLLSTIIGEQPLIENLDWTLETGILFCLALVTGAFLYVSNFYLIKTRWYNWLFGMYHSITDYFNQLGFDEIIHNKLNQNAIEWFGKNIFFNKTEFEKLSANDKNEIIKLQGLYYDRMYYELEYLEKIESPKAFQSFYFFFRQNVLASLINLIISSFTLLLEFFSLVSLSDTQLSKISIIALISLVLIIFSARLARWYRKRMVLKMFWTYFTHINLKKAENV